MATKNGKAKPPEKPTTVVEPGAEPLAVARAEQVAEARAAVLNWLRRLVGELGCMMNVIQQDKFKEAFTAAEGAKLSYLLDKLWRESHGDVEALAIPVELTARQYTPVVSRD